MARFRLAGSPRTGIAERSEEIGSDSTPRNGAGSIATDAADRPRPATICAQQPAEGVADHSGLAGQLPDHLRDVVGDLPDRLAWRTHRGSLCACSTVSGSSGHEGAQRRVPDLFEDRAAHRSQLLGSSHKPCMNTTGVSPDAFAVSICLASCSLMLAISWSPSGIRDDYRAVAFPAESAAAGCSRPGHWIDAGIAGAG